MTDLIERLESAERVSVTDMEAFCQVFRDMGLDEFPVTATRSDDGMRISVFAMALRDLSAAVALVERCAPEQVAVIMQSAVRGWAFVEGSGASTKLPIYIVIALLKALKAKEPSA